MEAPLPDEVRQAMAAIVEYNWAKELDDYAENYPECQGGHIFEHLVAVDNWLNGTDTSPEAYLPDSQVNDDDNASLIVDATAPELNREE